MKTELEIPLHTGGVTSSNLVSPTIQTRRITAVLTFSLDNRRRPILLKIAEHCGKMQRFAFKSRTGFDGRVAS